MYIEVKVINAFSINGTGGNPAGVVMHADHLTNEQKQLVAAKAGLSELAFLSESSAAAFQLDFFTPTNQIPHCGHATIAAFSYLKSIGEVIADFSSKETIDGIRQILFVGDSAFMQQSPAKFSPVQETDRILGSLGIGNDTLDNELPMVIGNTGNSFLLVPIRHEEDLANLKPDFKSIRQLSEELGCIGYYVFAQTVGEFDAQSRMFAPAYGIEEESATGMAAGPLGGLLYNYRKDKKTSYVFGQGKYMSTPSASRISVLIDPVSGSIMTGGNAYVGQTIKIQI